uniref:Doublecortin domain-containing protein n=1 Tax=Trypanosoma congolense (strain IL3000) TaxID=1068625 RepID=G0V0E8_TRYCI|nr:conserved hypothetical protein [Trypanosoma congolense IL3000]
MRLLVSLYHFFLFGPLASGYVVGILYFHLIYSTLFLRIITLVHTFSQLKFALVLPKNCECSFLSFFIFLVWLVCYPFSSVQCLFVSKIGDPMAQLTVYENHDIFLQNPACVYVPYRLQAMDELLALISETFAPTPVARYGEGRYRFAYSLSGLPLNSVEECIDAGKIVVAATSKFMPRKEKSRYFTNDEYGDISGDWPPNLTATISPVRDTVMGSSVHYNGMESTVFTSFPQTSEGLTRHSGKNPSALLTPIHRSSSVSPPLQFSAALPVSDSRIREDRLACYVSGVEVEVPSSTFDAPVTPSDLGITHVERVAAVKTLIMLKLWGRSFPDEDLLFEEELRSLFRPVIAEQSVCPLTLERTYESYPLHVMVEGPPKSGVTTALAYYSTMLVSSKESQYSAHLILPLNFELLFDGMLSFSSHGGGSHTEDDKGASYARLYTQSFLIDVPFFFMTIVRLLVDCAVAQRPSLRSSSTALVELWEQLIRPAVGNEILFNTYQVAHLVGHQALYRWETFATPAAKILNAARHALHDVRLRDALLELVLVELVAQVASALRFAGVVYIVDGLRPLSLCMCDRLKRPGGDASVLLDRISRRPWAHVAFGMDSLSLQAIELAVPTRMRRVRLLRMISVERLTERYNFPRALICGKKEYSIELFLGAPGYLHMLHELLLSCDKQSMREVGGYNVRIEDVDVVHALEKLSAVLQTAQDPRVG